MDKKLVEQIREGMKSKSTEELLTIWEENDRENWSKSLFARSILFCLAILCWINSAFAFTTVEVNSDLHLPISVNPEDLNLKTDDGRTFAILQDYSAELTIWKGATVEIRRQGGFLDNLQWSKGKAQVHESFRIGGLSIAREITYVDGVPHVTNCSVNGKPADGLTELDNSIKIDFRDPKLAIFLKPHSGLITGVYLVYFAAAILIIVIIVLFTVWKYRQRRAKLVTTL